MIDTDVVRLRQLRAAALRARALASALGMSGSESGTLLSRGAVSCWRIARVVTGRLRAHPYLSYQRDASAAKALFDRLNAHVLAAVARRQGHGLKVFALELKRVAREVDNARSLTWSPDLSDSLGRSQTEIRRLLAEVETAARKESGSLGEAGSRVDAGAMGIRSDAAAVEGNWPYLAF